MSLEQHIQELNGNILALIGALKDLGSANGAAPAASVDDEAERAIPLASPRKRPSKAAEAAADAAPPPAAPPAVSYDDVRKAVLKLAARDRKAAIDLLAQYGVKSATELPEASWADVITVAGKVLND